MGETVSDQSSGGMGAQDFSQLMNFVQQPPPQAQDGLDTTGAGKSTTSGAITSQEDSTIEQAKQPEGHAHAHGLHGAHGTTAANSTDNVEPENPTMAAPNKDVGAMAPGEVSQAHVNAFLCCIYGVALEMVMADILKTDMYKSMVGSQVFLNFKDMEGDMAKNIANAQISQGQVEFYTSMAKAACCGASAALNLTSALGSMKIDPNTKAGRTLGGFISSAQSMAGQDSVASNVAGGVGAVVKSRIEAQITMDQFIQKFMQDMDERMTSDQKKTDDSISQTMQMYMQWMNAMFQFTSKG